MKQDSRHCIHFDQRFIHIFVQIKDVHKQNKEAKLDVLQQLREQKISVECQNLQFVTQETQLINKFHVFNIHVKNIFDASSRH
jgi:hypothetical protein